MLALALGVSAQAQNDNIEERLNSLQEEVLRLKESQSGVSLGAEFSGLGKGASKVYSASEGLSIGGYGEVVWRKDSGDQGESFGTDVYRFIPYISYKFSDKLVLNSELEIEHGGETKMEFLYLDFLWSEAANLRLGHMLVPMGLVNQLHEPIYFPMIDRPMVEKNLIPSTWHENGALLFGEHSSVRYAFGLVTSPEAMSNATTTQFSKKSWIRGGRQGGAQANNEDMMIVGRADYLLGDMGMFGASFVTGDTAQSAENIGGAKLTIWDVHARLLFGDLRVDALHAQGSLENTQDIFDASGTVLGEGTTGSYVTLVYDVAPMMGMQNSLSPFVHWSTMNLHAEVADGLTVDDSLDQNLVSLGLNYYPHSNVVLKLEQEMLKDGNDDQTNSTNFGFGFVF